jgi:hypothetical protein
MLYKRLISILDVTLILKKKSRTGEPLKYIDPNFPKPQRRKWFAKLYPDYLYDGDRIGFAMVPVGTMERTFRNEDRDEDIVIVLQETSRVIVEDELGRKAESREVQMLEVLVRIRTQLDNGLGFDLYSDSPVSITGNA